MSETLTTEKLQKAWRDSKSIAESSESKDKAVVVSSLPAVSVSDSSEAVIPATAEVLQYAWRESQLDRPQ